MTARQPQCALAPSAEQAAACQLAEREAVEAETTAMATAFHAFQPLGEEARERALRWLGQALDLRRAYDREPPF